MKILTSLFMTIAILAGCTSSNSGGDLIAPTSKATITETALSGKQLREMLVGNTIVGRSNNFPAVGPINFWVYYDPNGTAKDRLKFARSGKVDRATGTWRIADEAQGIFCSKFSKRHKGAETCSRIFMANGQFRTKSKDAVGKSVTFKVIIGNQLQ